MLVRQAKDVARQWALDEGSRLTGFCGAYLAGSVTTLRDGASVPATSDVDITVVLTDPPPEKPGKFIYRDLLLEVSYMAWDQLQSVELILGDSQMAGSICAALILADPTGRLARIKVDVARQYASGKWVRRRCQQAHDMVLDRLRSVNEAASWHDQVTSWLFGTSLTAHLLTVADLRPPTVRRRYVVARELLTARGQLAFYQQMLGLLGCADWRRDQAEGHLAAVAAAFDTAKTLSKTPYRFAADISDSARPIALGGSRELIEQGYHREAVFWLVATYSRCQWIFHHDALASVRERFRPGYQRLLGDLAIGSFADLQNRCEQVEQFLPRVCEMAESIMAANPQIEG